MSHRERSIVYTWTDEAPALATYAFLPVVQSFSRAVGVSVVTRDLSLAGRILASFPESLREDQRVSDDLAELGRWVEDPEANVIKLPNISASVPQLKACIRELQGQGFALPDYPEQPDTPAAREIRARYDRVKGSAVNPVLRQGNSDRRIPRSVKGFARRNPPRMRSWPAESRTHVATMGAGDFRSNERSLTLSGPATVRIEHEAADGARVVLREGIRLADGDVLDAAFMSVRALDAFLREQVRDAEESGVLFSIHLKATMMKVSDPVLFGYAVRAYFGEVLDEHGPTLERIGFHPNNGIGDLFSRLAPLPAEERGPIEDAIRRRIARGPGMAMVNSDKGITNLHVPSDVIIDASMPPLIRDGGQMWNAAGALQDCKAVIPDASYAGIYDAVVRDCQARGGFDPSTMGSVPNVGLMAQAAEEYGSHDKTFEVPTDGTIRIVDGEGRVLLEHRVERGDIWRACRTTDVSIRDWVRLAVERARITGTPAIFWLDGDRPHDRELIRKVEEELSASDTAGLDLSILPPARAMQVTLDRIRRGEDTISVTGNVLRDYLTDLFPILEIGTSARMLSIVPLLRGGGVFETGAGGSAPKHVQQFKEEGHLRWDSLGEYMALAASFQHLADRFGVEPARVLAETLDEAVGVYLDQARSPSARVHELDNRGSTFHLTLYWARALASQEADPGLAARFRPVAESLSEQEAGILAELDAAQGQAQDLGGYYHPDPRRADAAMRPSITLNRIVEGIGASPVGGSSPR